MKAYKIVLISIGCVLLTLLMFNVNNAVPFLERNLGVNGATNFLVGILFLMFAAMLVFICLAAITAFKNEKKAITFRKELNATDKVIVKIMSGSFEGQVASVDNEFVTVVTKVRKHLVYPDNKK